MHKPVLINEVVHWLDPKPKDVVLDLTAGRGGHAEALVERVIPGGRVVAVDCDADAVRFCGEKFESMKETVMCVNENFRNVAEICRAAGVESVQGALIDCGISSAQLDDAERGFSFQRPGPLDMRTDRRGAGTLEHYLSGMTEKDLADAIYQYGEERFSRRIAGGIKRGLSEGRIQSTEDLAECIRRCVPGSYRRGRIHPATRTFQALRILVNDELGALDEALSKVLNVLAPGGRFAVIAFHSLEDRMVKNFFKHVEKDGLGRRLVKKPVRPGEEEIHENPRSRSAKLRVFERGEGSK